MNNWAAKIWSFTEEFNFMIMIGKYWAAKFQGRMNVWTMDADLNPVKPLHYLRATPYRAPAEMIESTRRLPV
eukprot:scaffold9244_cov141-Skeletonema_marinoi.AAC.3